MQLPELSNEVVAALVGAIAGGFFTGIFSYLVAGQSASAARRQADVDHVRERMLFPHSLKMQRLFELGDKVGFVLARSTPPMLKREGNPNAIRDYVDEFSVNSRTFFILGIGHGWFEPLQSYCRDLEKYVKGELSEEAIETGRKAVSSQMRDAFKSAQEAIT